MKLFYFFREKVRCFDEFNEIPYIGYSFNLNQQNAEQIVKRIGVQSFEKLKKGDEIITVQQADQLFDIMYQNAEEIVYSYCGEYIQNQKIRFVLIDMAYTLKEKLNQFQNLKQAIINNDYKNMGIEIIDSKYYVQTKFRAQSNVLTLLDECKDDFQANSLKELVIYNKVNRIYDAIDPKYLQSLKNQYTNSKIINTQDQLQLVEEQKSYKIFLDQKNEKRFVNYRDLQQLEQRIIEESDQTVKQEILFSLKYQHQQWLSLKYLEKVNYQYPTIKIILNGICEAAKSINIKMIELGIKYDKQTPDYQQWKDSIIQGGVPEDQFECDLSSELKNPQSVFVKSLLRIYTQETFLPYELNRACYEQIEDSIMKLGPYAAVLDKILFWAQSNKIDKCLDQKVVYRGVQYYESYIQFFKKNFEEDQPIQLNGFQSASFSKEIALSHAQKIKIQLKIQELKLVLFRIEIGKKQKYSYFILDDNSQYKNEKEVLIRDGLIFKIIDIDSSNPDFVLINVKMKCF